MTGVGFFTDTTVCIGCKACEVACKQWNDLPADGSEFRVGGSYDFTGELSATTWRHVRFVEQPSAASGSFEWLFTSDVCKHCTNAGCLDVCPTGALIRTRFGSVVLQADVCNGCGYCVAACPFGVIARDPDDGRAAKCTLCYDRLQVGLEPACAKSCPTDAIQFGDYEDLVDLAKRRVDTLHERGRTEAYLYGADDRIAGGLGAFFLLTAPPESFDLPATADSPVQRHLVPATVSAVTAGAAALVGTIAVFLVTARRRR